MADNIQEDALNNIKEYVNNLQTYKLSEDSTSIFIERDEVVGAIEAERQHIKKMDKS